MNAAPKQFYYQIDGSVIGPVTGVELRNAALAGIVLPSTLVANEPSGEWVLARFAQGLFDEGGRPLPHPPGTRQLLENSQPARHANHQANANVSAPAGGSEHPRPFYFKLGGEVIGPMTVIELRQSALVGNVKPTTLVANNPTGEWLPAYRVRGLFDGNGKPLPHPEETNRLLEHNPVQRVDQQANANASAASGGGEQPKLFYFKLGDDVIGPMTKIELQESVRVGNVTPSTLVANAPDGEWVMASRVGGLFDENGTPLPHPKEVQRILAATKLAECHLSATEPPSSGQQATSPGDSVAQPDGSDQPIWFYQYQRKVVGPVTGVQLQDAVHAGHVVPTTLVATNPGVRWFPASTVSGLFDTGAMPFPHTKSVERQLSGGVAKPAKRLSHSFRSRRKVKSFAVAQKVAICVTLLAAMFVPVALRKMGHPEAVPTLTAANSRPNNELRKSGDVRSSVNQDYDGSLLTQFETQVDDAIRSIDWTASSTLETTTNQSVGEYSIPNAVAVAAMLHESHRPFLVMGGIGELKRDPYVTSGQFYDSWIKIFTPRAASQSALKKGDVDQCLVTGAMLYISWKLYSNVYDYETRWIANEWGGNEIDRSRVIQGYGIAKQKMADRYRQEYEALLDMGLERVIATKFTE